MHVACGDGTNNRTTSRFFHRSQDETAASESTLQESKNKVLNSPSRTCSEIDMSTKADLSKCILVNIRLQAVWLEDSVRHNNSRLKK